MSFIKTDPREVFSCGVFYSILVGSTTLSNLYLASYSIDRSLMILYPMRYRSVGTQSRVILRILCIGLIIISLLVPHHFYLHYDSKATLFLCKFPSLIRHKKIHLLSIIHAILFVSIPTFIVFISSLILLRNRCHHKRLLKNNSSLNSRMPKRSIFIVLASLWLFLSLLPTFILEIIIVYDQFFHHDMYCSIEVKVYKILLDCYLIFSSTNYSIKFYIHLLVSISFRKSFIQFITCKYHHKSSKLIRIHNVNDKQHYSFAVRNRNQEIVTEV